MSQNLITVPFRSANLLIVDHEGQPYVPMKLIVEGMGLDWSSQHAKLKETQRFSSTVVEIAIVAEDGKQRQMTCMPLRKLPGWLMTISPNKVNPESRNIVIAYQEECDDVLWKYWMAGQAVNPRGANPQPAPIDPPISAGMRLFAQAHEFAKTILELNPNQAKLSADVCCKKSLNLSVLGHFDITYLPANEKGQTYTPTQLGAEWLDPPASGRYMNLLLKDVGLQVKDREKHWIPTELANGYYEWVDTTKQHCVGTPIKQVRWYITVLDKMREILREREAQQQAA